MCLNVTLDNSTVFANYNKIIENNIADLKLNDNGFLVKKSKWNKFIDLFSFGSSNELKESIEAIIKVVDLESNNIITKNLINSPKINEFFEKVARSKNNPILTNTNIISLKLQNFLDPELKRLREEKKNTKNDIEHQFQRRIQKAKLAEKLGILPHINKGACGTIIIKGLSKQEKYKQGKNIGIFKRGYSRVPVLVRIKNIFKKTFWGQLHYLSKQEFSQANAEVAAYLLDKKFGFGITPPSQKLNLMGEEGTFQHFLRDNIEAKDLLMIGYNNKKNYTENELIKFQMLAIYDYLTGNLDRHEENWFVKINSAAHAKLDEISKAQSKRASYRTLRAMIANQDFEKLEIVDLKGIDNANSFPIKHARRFPIFNSLSNQYKWKQLNIAAEKFRPEIVEFASKLTDQKIEEFLKELEEKLPGFMEIEMEKTFKDRLIVLRNMVNLDKTPQNLAEISSYQKITQKLKTLLHGQSDHSDHADHH